MTAFAEQYAQIQDEANRRTNASIASQQAGVKNLTDLYNGFAASANNADGQTAETLQRRADAMAQFSEQLKNGTSDFNYLDQSSLSALEASVDAAKAKVQQLADAAKAAAQQFADLAQQTQDALDQASGNQTAIEDRRHAKALADLQAEAKAAGELNSATYQQAVANENALF